MAKGTTAIQSGLWSQPFPRRTGRARPLQKRVQLADIKIRINLCNVFAVLCFRCFGLDMTPEKIWHAISAVYCLERLRSLLVCLLNFPIWELPCSVLIIWIPVCCPVINLNCGGSWQDLNSCHCPHCFFLAVCSLRLDCVLKFDVIDVSLPDSFVQVHILYLHSTEGGKHTVYTRQRCPTIYGLASISKPTIYLQREHSLCCL